jgi:magnesium-transporting ATPase (P-type)
VSELIYKASSPDEEALCRAAKDNGIVFISRSTQSITVQVNGDKLVYEVLCSMEFTSDRRRMSVVVRTPEGELKLLTKGADTMMYSRLGDGDDELKEKTLQDLDVFSKEVRSRTTQDTRTTHKHDTHDTQTHTHDTRRTRRTRM